MAAERKKVTPSRTSANQEAPAMKAYRGTCIPFLVFALAAVAAPGWGQGSLWSTWGETIAKKLQEFLPAAAPGLIAGFPWDSAVSNQPSTSGGCGEGTGGCPTFYPVSATQQWRFDEPTLVQQVTEAEKQVEAEMQALVQQSQDPGKRFQKCLEDQKPLAEERTRKIQELIRQGKYDEIEKLPPLPDCQNQSLQDLDTKRKELEKRVPDLQARGRSLGILIEGNTTPRDWYEPGLKPASTLQGYPLYRVARSEPAFKGTPEHVSLAVFVGPAGFVNPPAPGGKTRGELKCVLVRAELRSRPDTAKADEAVAREMLEKVDYAGLAKLLQGARN